MLAESVVRIRVTPVKDSVLVSIGLFACLASFPQPAAERLRLGRLDYVNLSAGRKVGDYTIDIRQVSGVEKHYAFEAVARFSNRFGGFESQQWTCVTTRGLQPISASLTFGNSHQLPAFSITYRSDRVTGFVRIRKGPEAGKTRAVDTILPRDTFDQRLDWATLVASDLQSGAQFRFNVYDPVIGLSHAYAQVGDVRRLRVPAGTFEVYPIVYKIAKSTGSEEYKIFVTQSQPRLLIREDFENGVVGQLAKIEQ
jgi:hypothetical protein